MSDVVVGCDKKVAAPPTGINPISDIIEPMQMKVKRAIDAPASAVWDRLTDTQQWSQWGPSVRAVECADRYIRHGSRGRVLTTLGLWAPFTITDFDDGRYWSWRVYGLPATGHRVETLDMDRCRLIFEIPIVATPYAAVCKIAVERIARQVISKRVHNS